MLKIGFIGLGNLGSPIAANLAEKGHVLFVYNRTASRTLPLEEKGAIACRSVAGLAAEVPIVFSMVSDDAALRSVTEGENGLLSHLGPGGIHVSMSTILPGTAAELHQLHRQAGQEYLAAPVFGRPEAARSRKLNFVVAGTEAAKSLVKPLLEDAGASGVWDFGLDPSTANTVKLCGNFLIAAALEAIGESVHLARRSGVDAEKMWAMFSQTLFNTPLYQNYSQIILKQHFDPAAFTMKLGLKDLNLVLQQAGQSQQPMPLAQLLKKQMQELVDSGQPDIDWSAVSMAARN
jgi:3-hydroxyisobutyrate dehydrogenase-like beta-hydroxyacid dehydrogenase